MTNNVIHENDYYVPEEAPGCPVLNERIPETDTRKNRARRVPKGRRITTKELIPACLPCFKDHTGMEELMHAL